MSEELSAQIRKYMISEINEYAIFADGFEHAIIGVCYRAGQPPVVCYDYDICIKILMNDSECSLEEALEYFEYNTMCAWVGKNTPAFIKRIKGGIDESCKY